MTVFAFLLVSLLCFFVDGAIKVTYIYPRVGGSGGAVRLTVFGEGFLESEPDYQGGGGDPREVKVYLVNSFGEYICDVGKDGSTNRAIVCYTRPMPGNQNYYVKLVSGNEVSYLENCRNSPRSWHCTHAVRWWRTPDIRSIYKWENNIEHPQSRSYFPGELLQLYGRLYTDTYGSNNQTSSNSDTASFRRVYVGGHSCELMNQDTSQPYYLQLDDSYHGKVSCKTQGTFIGYSNVSFILTSEYGRSVPRKELYHVSGNDVVHMVKSYAAITGISPSVGSTEGGTVLTVFGKHFDTNVAVSVGGVDCKVIKNSVTLTSLKCVTGKEPEKRPSIFKGSRGIYMEWWNETILSPQQTMDQLNGSESDYRGKHVLQETGYTWDFYQNFVAKYTGIFVAPRTDSYKFHLKSDDVSEFTMHCPKMNYTFELDSHRYSSHYWRFSGQISEWYFLQEGDECHFTTAVVDYGGQGYLYIAVLRQKTTLTNTQAIQAVNEKQKIDFTAEENAEHQKLTFYDWLPEIGTAEKQSINIVCQTCSTVEFRLIYCGLSTGYLPYGTSASNLKSTLLELVSACGENDVEVQRVSTNKGIKFDITFKTKLGNKQMIHGYIKNQNNQEGVSLTVTEEVRGRPDYATFTLFAFGRSTTSIAYNGSAEEVQSALMQITKAHCSKYILPPKTDSNIIAINDYETDDDSGDNSGDIVQEIPAFCGVSSLKNPSFVYKADTTAHLTWKQHKSFSPLLFRVICFAHFGTFQHIIGIGGKFRFTIDNEDKTEETLRKFSIDIAMNNKWSYSCLDLVTIIQTHYTTLTDANIDTISFYQNTGNFYIDAVYIGREKLVPNDIEISQLRKPGGQANGKAIGNIIVNKNGSYADYDIVIETVDCGYQIPFLMIEECGNPEVNGNTSLQKCNNNKNLVKVQRIKEATPPMTGMFNLQYINNGTTHILKDIPVNSSATELKYLLESIQGFGSTNVKISGKCHSIDYEVEWTSNGGKKELLVVNATNVEGGPGLSASVHVSQNGGIFHDPIPGEMLRLPYKTPQVEVLVNGIPSMCKGNCSFDWRNDATPLINSFTPSSGPVNTILKLTGTMLGNEASTNVSVSIGLSPCSVLHHNETCIICQVMSGPSGIYKIDVSINQYGRAKPAENVSLAFNITAGLNEVSPLIGFTTGGGTLTVLGYGFTVNSTINVGLNQCKQTAGNVTNDTILSTILHCVIPPGGIGTVDVTLWEDEILIDTLPSIYTYSDENLPVVNSIQPNQTAINGGNLINITGKNLGSVASEITVNVGEKMCKLAAWSETGISCQLPSLDPGVYSVTVYIGNQGTADMLQNNVGGVEYILLIDDYTPKSGSLYGSTLVSISGKGFVNDETLQVTIGSTYCRIVSVDWRNIQCKTNTFASVHYITNNGYHRDYGQGLAWEPQVLTISVGDMVTWKWTIPTTLDSNWGARVFSIAKPFHTNFDGRGFISSTSRSVKGYFSHKFIEAGVYHYSSGYIDGDSSGRFVMTGTIHVIETANTNSHLKVSLGGHLALFRGVNKKLLKKRSMVCNTVSKIANCEEDVNITSGFVVGGKCYTPVVSSVKPSHGSRKTLISITGFGFAADNCANVVQIGDYTCNVVYSNHTLIQCFPHPTNVTKVGIAYAVEVSVNNIGKASSSLELRFALLPDIETIFPLTGSLEGGTLLTITGFGFSEEVSVYMGGVLCVVYETQYNELKCKTMKFSQETTVNVSLTINSHLKSVCTGNCEFTSSSLSTPQVNDIVPNPVTSDNTSLRIKGSGFTDGINNASVLIGDQVCKVQSVNGTVIQCHLNYLPVGQHNVQVTISDDGLATFLPTDKQNIISSALYSINPTSGSISGGSIVTFEGHGFAVTDFEVFFDGKPCQTKSDFSNTKFQCETPSQDQSKFSTVSFFPPNQFQETTFHYDDSLTPIINSIYPTKGTSGEIFSIKGSQLNGTNTTVFIGDAICELVFGNATQIDCIVGEHKGGAYKVNVLAPNLGFAYSNHMFFYDINISSLTPSEGGYGGNIVLVLKGVNFDSSMSIQVCDNFCTHNANLSFANSTSIACTLDPEPILIYGTQSAIEIHGSYLSGNYLSVSSTTSKQLGHFMSNYTGNDDLEIPSVKQVTENALSPPMHFTLLFTQRNDRKQTVMAWRPVPKPGFVCLGDIVTLDQTQPQLTEVDCVHKGLTLETNLTYQIWETKDKTVAAWKIAESVFSVFTNQQFTREDTIVYRLKNRSETVDYSVDKLCPVTIGIESNYVVTSTLFKYKAAYTPVVSGISPLRGGTGGGVVVTINGQGFSDKPSEVNVIIAGIPCDIINSSLTQIICTTGSSFESINSLINVIILGKGQAVNSDTYFEYVDLWSSPFTWGGLDPPTTGDFVVIKRGQTLVLDTNTQVLKFLLIDGGKLIFDNKNIELQAEYILITNGGLLQIGTEDKPFQKKAIITLHGHLRSREIPIYGTKVLGVRNGTLEMHGKHVNPTWTHLVNSSHVGSRVLHLKEPVSWSVGDDIVIASTGHRHSQKETEVRTISLISTDKTAVYLTEPLIFEHVSLTQVLQDGTTIETKAEVGLLTRNIVVRGSKKMEWNDVIPACEAGFNTGEFATQTCFQGRFGEEEGSDEFGATVMIHPRYTSRNIAVAHIEYVEFTEVGQAFRLGRYPIHFHILGDANFQSYVRGCAIHKTFNRAVTIHHTHHVLVENNVVYNVKGGAMFIEDGIEHGNILQYNLVLFCRQSTSLQNDDITPAAFWVTNPNNTIRHNAAAGGTHFGFWYRMHVHPDGPSYDSNICQQRHHLGEFQNNTVHSQGWFGLWIFQTYTPKKDQGCSSQTPEVAKFFSLTTWNCEKGSEVVNSGSIQFHNFVMVNNEFAGIETKRIIDQNVLWGQAGIFNSIIVAYSDVSKPGERTKQGVVMPLSEASVLVNVTFVNFDQQGSSAIHGTTITGTCGDLCGGFPYRLSGLRFYNSPNKVHFRWEHDLVLYDLDGSLTESGSAKVVVPQNPSLPPSCTVAAEFSLGIKGTVCPGNLKFHRVAWNKVLPSSLEAKNVSLLSQYGESLIEFRKKRMTHKPGWMCTMIDGEQYRLTYINAEQITNISYTAGFYDFQENDCVIISHKLTQKPDNTQIYPSIKRNASKSMVTCADNSNGDFYFDSNNLELYYIVSGKDTTERSKRGADSTAVTRNVEFQAYRCAYKDCYVPPNVGFAPLARERPDNAKFWSEVSSWSDAEEGWGGYTGVDQFALPKNGTKVKIHSGVWMVADVDLPHFTELWIEGVLELDGQIQADGTYKNFVLEATHIIITGRLIIGWDDAPFQGNVLIKLNGDIYSKEYLPSPEINMGAKAIGVFGGLDLHGKKKETVWTKLSSTVNVGDVTITVDTSVDWNTEDEIVLTTTSFDPYETETFSIVNLDETRTVITLNSSAKYKHLAKTVEYLDYSGAPQTYSMKGEVGLLTRNIKVVGTDYQNLYEESFGGRILVGSYVNRTGTEFRGFARVEDVEFYHTGQEGFIDSFDPRYSIAFLRTGTVDEFRPSYVRRCAFHHGFNTAVGVFGAKGIPIDQNVIHHTVGPSIRVEGMNHRVTNNLATVCRTRSVYQNRYELDIVLWKGAIEIYKGESVTLFGNIVAGSERAGYRLNGVECSFGSEADPRNEARGVLEGIFMNKYDGFPTCTTLANFNIHKAFDFGIYYQGDGSLQIDNVLITDSFVGVAVIVKGPASLSHVYKEKQVSIKKSTFSALTETGDCSTLPLTTDYVSNNNFARSPSMQDRTGDRDSRIAIMWPSFSSSQNGAPKKPFAGAMSYPALGGKTYINDVTFINFDDKECARTRHTILMTNPQNEDYLHPIYTSSLGFVNSSKDTFVFFHRPSLGKINPADCVDMECDAMKHGIITDDDGSVLGTPGTIIPQAEFEWNGDPRRGLGDYRIPKTMLTRLDGSRIPVNSIAPNKGILRANTTTTSCTTNNAWRGHQCHGYHHELFIIESLDSDSETRRLSPVALLCDQYVDLYNGPQDHGWCSGYTCQQRISTFWTVVALNRTYDLHFSGTPPQDLRVRLPNAQLFPIVLKLFYTTPRRLDVYVNNIYVPALNSKTNEKGEYIILPFSSEFIPNLSSGNGANYFDREAQTLYITLHGGESVDIFTADVLFVSFEVPAISPDDFFDSDNLVNNLASFLGIDKSRIRIVDIVRASKKRRKRRNTSASSVVLEIGDQPKQNKSEPEPTIPFTTASPFNNDSLPTGETPTSANIQSFQALRNLTSKIVNALQDGSISKTLNLTVLSVGVVPPLPPPGGDLWREVSNNSIETPTASFVRPDQIQILTHPRGQHSGDPFEIQPQLEVIDTSGRRVINLGFLDPWVASVSTIEGSKGYLSGSRSVPFTDGVATFTDLGFNKSGSYKLRFWVSHPPGNERFAIDSSDLKIIDKPKPVDPESNQKTTMIIIIVACILGGILVIGIIAFIVKKTLEKKKSAKVSIADSNKHNDGVETYTPTVENEYVTKSALATDVNEPKTSSLPHAVVEEKTTQTDPRSDSPQSLPPPYNEKDN